MKPYNHAGIPGSRGRFGTRGMRGQGCRMEHRIRIVMRVGNARMPHVPSLFLFQDCRKIRCKELLGTFLCVLLIFCCGGRAALAEDCVGTLRRELEELRRSEKEISARVDELAKREPRLRPDERNCLSESRALLPVLKTNVQQISIRLKLAEKGLDGTQGINPDCPVHACRMKVEKCPIRYGMLLVRQEDPPEAIRRKYFPFAQKYYMGGCVTDRYSPDVAKVYVCEACRKAEKAWKRTR